MRLRRKIAAVALLPRNDRTRCNRVVCAVYVQIRSDFSENWKLKTENYPIASETSVTELIIPDGVTEIGKYAFQGCTQLASVSLPESLKTIGESAFDIGRYNYLVSVEFRGTADEWNAVEIGEYNTYIDFDNIKFGK